MHPFFQPLTSFETSLLLVAHQREASMSCFRFLPTETQQRLNEKKAALEQLSAEAQTALCSRAYKEMLAHHQHYGTERIDPSWIVRAMQGESPRMVAALMVLFPAAVSRAIYKSLPDTVQNELPSKESVSHIHPALLQNLRLLFDKRFAPMPLTSPSTLCFQTILSLESTELHTLCRDLGLIELGQSFAVIGKGALLELCRRLTREQAQEVVNAVATASRIDLPHADSAHYFLAHVVENFHDTEEFFQKAGLWRLAKACMGESETLVTQLKQRLPALAGELMCAYVEKTKELPDTNPHTYSMMQDSIILRIRQLSARQALSAQWAQLSVTYHHPERIKQLEQEQKQA